MALSLAAAALGSAVIGAGAAAHASSQAKKAANKSLAAQNAATDKSIAAQQAALDKIIGLNQGAINGGNLSLAQLLTELGITPSANAAPRAPAAQLSYDAAGNVIRAPTAAPVAASAISAPFAAQPPSGGPTGSPAPAPTQEQTFEQAKAASEARSAAARAAGGSAGTSPIEPAPQAAPAQDWNAYNQAYGGDVAAEYARLQSTPEGQARLQEIGVDSPEAFGQYHYQNFGQGAGREVPMTQAQAAVQPQAQSQTTDPNAPPDLTTAGRPQAAAATDYTSQAPDLASFFSNFEADPGAAYRKSEALNGVNAFSAARGKLRSGDAAKSLATLASDLGSQEYNNWFTRQNTLYNNSRNAFQNDRADNRAVWQYGVDRGDQNFNTDRGYQTTQDNTRIGNLFDVAKLGQQAAGNVSGATTNNANAQTSLFGSQANNQADAAYARANANAGLVGNLAGTATNLFANWGGGSGSATNAAQPFNQTGFNKWAQGTW